MFRERIEPEQPEIKNPIRVYAGQRPERVAFFKKTLESCRLEEFVQACESEPYREPFRELAAHAVSYAEKVIALESLGGCAHHEQGCEARMAELMNEQRNEHTLFVQSFEGLCKKLESETGADFSRFLGKSRVFYMQLALDIAFSYGS